MLVVRYLNEVLSNFNTTASEEKKILLETEMVSLMTWGERKSIDVKDVERKESCEMRVIEYDGKPMEIEFSVVVWDLEKVNELLIPDLDNRILTSYKLLKQAGIERPSAVLSQGFFTFILQKKFDTKWDKRYSVWTSVNLVLKRLQSNARIAARYEFPDKFGPRVCVGENGEGIYLYGKKAWSEDMKTRGMIGGKKT